MSSIPNERAAPGVLRFIIVALGVIFFVMNAHSFYEQYRLKHFGTTAQARVIRTSITRRKGGPSYGVDYEIAFAGKTFGGSGEVSAKTYRAIQRGSLIPIRYVPSNPSLSETAEMSHNDAAMVLRAVLGFPLSLFIILYPLRKRQPRQELSVNAVLPVEDIQIHLPPAVKGIAFTMYPVTDMARARRFYEGDLGLRVARDLQGEWIEYHLWGSCFAITTFGDGPLKPSSDAGASIAFEVNDLDGWIAQLKEKGTRIKRPPFSTPNCRMAVILDPEGNALTLHEKVT